MKKVILDENTLKLLKENLLLDNIKLPKEIVKSIELNKHSLGDHPAFPLEDENRFEYKILKSGYEDALNKLETFDLPDTSKTTLTNRLSKILIDCNRLEAPIKSQLEKICIELIKEIFGVTADDVDFSCSIVDSIIDKDINLPLQPEGVEYTEFEGVEDIKGINNEIYKRRMVNCLMEGIAHAYVTNYGLYLGKVFELNHILPAIYSEIISINTYLNYLIDANKFDKNSSTQGAVSDVIVKKGKSIVEVKGINFISMLRESVRAMLDLISFNGLPEDIKKAEYVLSKSDFMLANTWDVRFGVSLWSIITNLGDNIEEYNNITPPLFYKIITLPTDEFNSTLQEIFSKTKRGRELLNNMVEEVNDLINTEEFYSELDNKRQINLSDNHYFQSEELF